MKICQILSTAFMLIFLPVHAEWNKVASGEAEDLGQNIFYVDFTRIEKSGNMRKVPELVDFDREFNGARSIETVSEFDCKRKTVRVLTFLAYSGNMAKGTRIYSDLKPRQIEAISGDKVYFMNVFCSK